MDFRGVYASVIKNWMGVDPTGIIDGMWPLLDFVQPVTGAGLMLPSAARPLVAAGV